MKSSPATTSAEHSPGPWSSMYSPYRVRRGEDGPESELPAFEVFDAEGEKVFDTNEDMPAELQEANARLGAAAPRLLKCLVTCATLLADFDEADCDEGDAYREALAVIAETTGTSVAGPAELGRAGLGALAPFDAYEIHGMKRTSLGGEAESEGFVYHDYEQVPDGEAGIWGLFGHIPGQGLESIGDFATREQAEVVFARITGRRYPRTTP